MRQPLREVEPPARVALHDRAADNLAFIRSTMANSAAFTGVSGVGMIGMGVVALVGAWLATRSTDLDWWINCWTGVAILGCGVGVAGVAYKSRKHGTPVFFGAGRKFVLNFSPAIVAGIVFSEVLYIHGLDLYLPALWLLLYGVAVIGGGAFSVPPIPIMGVCFMAAGVAALFLPDKVLNIPGTVRPADLLLTATFGGFHIGFGALVARRHGG